MPIPPRGQNFHFELYPGLPNCQKLKPGFSKVRAIERQPDEDRSNVGRGVAALVDRPHGAVADRTRFGRISGWLGRRDRIDYPAEPCSVDIPQLPGLTGSLPERR